MSQQSLEDLLKTTGNPVNMLRNSQIGAYVYPVVPAEYTNWRDEQRAWRETCVLFDQSHHMVEQYVEGPDALKLISHLATNSFAKFPVNRAKQFVPCSYDGHIIGDGILFHLEENKLSFVGRAPSANWIEFHADDGRLQRDDEERRPVAVAPGRQARHPQLLSLPDPGTQREAGDRETQRRPGAGHQVLQHGCHHDRRPQGPRAAPRHGRRAGPRSVGPVRRGRGNPRGDRRSRPANSACIRSATARTRRTRSNPAGFRRRSPRCTPARR